MQNDLESARHHTLYFAMWMIGGLAFATTGGGWRMALGYIFGMTMSVIAGMII